MVRKVGVVHALRRAGQAVMPKGRFRTLANSLLLAIERRRGSRYTVADMQLRFLPGSTPATGEPTASVHERMDAVQVTLFAQALRRGDVVADVGAYRGEYSVVAAARIGDAGHVLAFEPIAANGEFIRRNLALNHLAARVTLVPKAVSAEAGTLRFFTAGSSSANSLFRGAIEPHSGGVLEEVTVMTTSLDAEFAAFGRMPDVVKIDIEGAEFQALRGAEAIVRSHAIIFCELHPYAWSEAGHSGEDLLAWLHERGREIVELESDQPVREWRYGPVRVVVRDGGS